jgi:hypothetical protein
MILLTALGATSAIDGIGRRQTYSRPQLARWQYVVTCAVTSFINADSRFRDKSPQLKDLSQLAKAGVWRQGGCESNHREIDGPRT